MDPITKSRFKVVIAGGSGSTSSELMATAIGAVQSSLGVAKLKKGSKSLTARSADDSVTVSTMRIEFNVGSPGWKDVITWWSDTNDFGKPLNKRNVEVIIYDGEEAPVQSILLEGAWPCTFGFLGGSTEANSGSMGQYLEFVSEGFRIAAKQPKAETPPASPTAEKPKVEKKNEFNAIKTGNVKVFDKVLINTGDVHSEVGDVNAKVGDVTGLKGTSNIKDSFKATGVANISGKAAISMGAGALSAVGGVASILKPSPKVSATATATAISSGKDGIDSAPKATNVDTEKEVSSAASQNSPTASASPSSSSSPSNNPGTPGPSTSSASSEDLAPAIAGTTVAATTGAAALAGAGEDVAEAREALDSATESELPEAETEPKLESVSYETSEEEVSPAADTSAAETGSADAALENGSAVTSQSDSPSETGSAMAAAAVMGMAASLTSALKGKGSPVPIVDFGTSQTKNVGARSPLNETPKTLQKKKTEAQVAAGTENKKSSKEYGEASDQTLATRASFEVTSPKVEAGGKKTEDVNPGESRAKVTIGKPEFSLEQSLEGRSAVTVYWQETEREFPDLIVHERGGMTEKTQSTVYEIIEKDLCAEKSGKKGKTVEYRWCGKIIYLKSDQHSLVFQVRDEALRAALHDSLRAIFR